MTEYEIVKLLHDLGIKEHLRGFKYLVDSILLFQENDLIEDIYTVISKEYNINKYNVERSIRYTIERSFNYKLTLNLFNLDYNKDKPTNKEFIYTISKRLKNN